MLPQEAIAYIKVFLIRFLRHFGFERIRYKKLSRIFYFKELYDKIRDVEGDIVECGVAYGGSLVILGALAQGEGKARRVYGFDSFEGFPEPTAADQSFRNSKEGEYGDATIAKVKNVFRWANIAEPILVKGFIEDTAKNFRGKIAFLHVDVDLYNSYKVILKELVRQVTRGGVILFDDYGEPKFPGAKQAVDEFLLGKDYKLQRVRFMDKFRYFIIKN